MERLVLKAKPRIKSSKGAVKSLRAAGLIPAVVYGRKEETKVISVDAGDIHQAMSTSAGGNVLLTLKIEDQDDLKQETVMIKDLQREILIPDRLKHIDFIRISMKDKIEVEVPLYLEGEPVGVKEGGVIQQQLREVILLCLPTDIPESLEVDVSHLQLGDSLSVGDLKVPENTELVNEPQETVVSILSPALEEETEATEDIDAADVAVIGEEKDEEETEGE